jgi:hypothetical protein
MNAYQPPAAQHAFVLFEALRAHLMDNTLETA